MTARVGRSRGEWFERLVPCNLRTRRALQLSDLYRGFEFLSLRHAVWGAEKSVWIAPEMEEMGAIPQLWLSNRTGESVALESSGELSQLFLRRGYAQSGSNDCIRRKHCHYAHWPVVSAINPFRSAGITGSAPTKPAYKGGNMPG
jgi:hypothetical protein